MISKFFSFPQKKIPRLKANFYSHPGAKLKHPLCPKRARIAIGFQVVDNFNYTTCSIEKDYVDRILHKPGVYRIAGLDKKSRSGFQNRCSQKSPCSFQHSLRKPDTLQKKGIGSSAADLTRYQNIPSRRNFMRMGKAKTIKVVGKMKMTSGPISLTGASMAFFSAL